MKTCVACGAAKPTDAAKCPACEQIDEEVLRRMMMGTPSLTLLVLAVAGFWVYRFWHLGWVAWGGNLRTVSLVAVVLGFTTLIQPIWSFGIRSRKLAAIVFVLGVSTFLVFNTV